MRFWKWRGSSLVILPVGIILSGCHSPQHVRPAEGNLERGIRYTEMTSKGKAFAIPMSSGPISHVPMGAEVDVNSTILIQVDTATIQVAAGYAPDRSVAMLSEDKAKKLREALLGIQKVVEARTTALAAYEKTKAVPAQEFDESPAEQEFDVAVTAFGIAKSSLTALPIFNDGTFSLAERNPAFRDKTLQQLGALVQRELDKAETALRKESEQALANSAPLRLRAFLQPPKGENAPIHLDGYDTYDQLEVKLKDPSVIDADDWKVLEAQYQQVVDLAKQAEKVRTGELSLNKALYASGSGAITKLLDQVESFRPLFEKDWPSTLRQLRGDLWDFSKEVREILKKHGQTEISTWEISARDLPAAVLNDLPVSQFKEVAGEIATLRDSWNKVTPDSFLATYQRTQQLPAKIETLKAALDTVRLEQTKAALDEVRGRLERRPEEMKEEAWAEIQTAMKRSPAFIQANEMARQVASATTFLREAAHLLEFRKVDPIATDLRSPQVKNVPLQEARSTNVDLRRTSRVVDDRIVISASLGADEAQSVRGNASFVVKEFGWHTVMAPSVILSRPLTSHTAYDREFKFSPGVAYLKRYYPRDFEPEWWNALARLTQPGFGVHVAFLDHSPDRDTEIGTGAAFSFVQDLIVIGGGVNLMNNSKGYFYFGSNLIPILQKLGFGKDGGAGKKP